MASTRLRIVYFLLLPLMLVAIGVLTYYSLQTAAQFARLGEKSIADSSLWLARDRVNRLERRIIAADNRVFQRVDLGALSELDTGWRRDADTVSPSVRAVLVLDEDARVIALSARANQADRKRFEQRFQRDIVPDLRLGKLRYNRLMHRHATYGEQVYLISYKAMRYRGRRYYLAAHHDVGYLVRTVFPELFVSEGGEQLLSVVDRNNHTVFGPSMANAGDYIVGYKFPTTLYEWRLQVAPRSAPLLEAKGRTTRVNQIALIGLCLVVILVAVLATAYVADKERRLATLKSEFIANVSHELKTPLSVIRMFGEMLLTGRVKTEDKRLEYLNIICSESERLGNLIQNVLDFAALERGKQSYAMHERDLGELVERAIEAFRYRLEREGAEVRLVSHGGPARGRVDEQSMLLAVINMLDNAVKYGAGTPVEVSIEAAEQEVTISVRDHGQGIPSHDLKRVFERFYRSTKETRVRGSGIGLSLVKHIAEAHGGRAFARNADDGGAVVSVTVPRTGKPKPSRGAQIDTPGATDIVGGHG